MSKDIVEIEFHGRGGQGAKSAAAIIADAAFRMGKYIQSFPEYGAERQGAPVVAFTRISDKPIRIHTGIVNPDAVVVIDPTLLRAVNVTDGVDEKEGVIILNTPNSPQQMKAQLGFNGKLACVDATKIAIEETGSGVTNTAMLGALVKVSPMVPLEIVIEEIRAKFQKKLGEDLTNKNVRALERAFNEVKIE